MLPRSGAIESAGSEKLGFARVELCLSLIEMHTLLAEMISSPMINNSGGDAFFAYECSPGLIARKLGMGRTGGAVHKVQPVSSAQLHIMLPETIPVWGNSFAIQFAIRTPQLAIRGAELRLRGAPPERDCANRSCGAGPSTRAPT